jgi:hypothetical protein
MPATKYMTLMQLSQWWWACEPTYVFSNLCLKASIGIFLLRIATQPVHRMILWVSLITVQLYGVFFFLLFTFQCWPGAFPVEI